jgi:histidyl-tRNA synthetase
VSDRRVQKLAAMRDLGPAESVATTRLAETLSKTLKDAGFESISTPILEEAELFTRKGSLELIGSLYAFSEPGGRRISLRPEFTSSIIRYVAENQNSLDMPARFRYRGPVFRYHRGGNGTYRQYTQIGAELVGSPGPEADAEIISVATTGLKKAGISGINVRIGHLGVLNAMLANFDLSPAANRFVIRNLQTLQDNDTVDLLPEAIDAGLIRTSAGESDPGGTTDSSRLATLLIETLGDTMAKPVGRRTTEEIIARLLRKSKESNDPVQFSDAVSFISQLIRNPSKPDDLIYQARTLCRKHKIPDKPLEQIQSLINALSKTAIPDSAIKFDLGLARGVSYYTGLVFELTTPELPKGAYLAGGGRYDGLIETLGGKKCDALGFTYDLDYVLSASQSTKGRKV